MLTVKDIVMAESALFKFKQLMLSENCQVMDELLAEYMMSHGC